MRDNYLVEQITTDKWAKIDIGKKKNCRNLKEINKSIRKNNHKAIKINYLIITINYFHQSSFNGSSTPAFENIKLFRGYCSIDPNGYSIHAEQKGSSVSEVISIMSNY